jgi:hypothetical protein
MCCGGTKQSGLFLFHHYIDKRCGGTKIVAPLLFHNYIESRCGGTTILFYFVPPLIRIMLWWNKATLIVCSTTAIIL